MSEATHTQFSITVTVQPGSAVADLHAALYAACRLVDPDVRIYRQTLPNLTNGSKEMAG